MTRAADLSAVVVVSARHCDGFGCEKCRARSRWMRRKFWRARKSPNRSVRNNRKR
jgi:hypothetical protein